MTARISSVKNYLKSQFMLADEEWITGCVEYLTEDSSNHYTEREIQNLAKEQWLLNDLKDICPGSLPANLKHQQKTVLSGRYALQINSVIDIGTPAYQQYLKLLKVNMENVEATTTFEDKIASHRMIKLYLTDGVQQVTAIEYKPMRNLSCDILPGCKMLLKGPVECRRGMFLLTESSIELLGGEVQEIVQSNSLAGLLANKLRLPLPQESNPDTSISTNQPRISHIPTPHADMPPRSDQDHTTITSNEHHTRPIARVTSVQVANFNDDDIDFDQLAAIEAEISISNGKTTTADKNNATNVKNNKVSNSKNHPSVASTTNEIRNEINPSCKRPSDNEFDVPDKKVKINNDSDYPNDEDLFCEDEDYLREIEDKLDIKEQNIIKQIIYPVKISKEPFVYIKQINELTDIEKVGRKFKIKAQILKLTSKLVVSKEGWSLKCELIDGTASLDVEFTSDVLSKLVGITPSEMNKMKKDMVHNPELKEKVVSALYKAKESLEVLYCIIEITILDAPKITQLIPFDLTHEVLLKKRLEGTGL